MTKLIPLALFLFFSIQIPLLSAEQLWENSLSLEIPQNYQALSQQDLKKKFGVNHPERAWTDKSTSTTIAAAQRDLALRDDELPHFKSFMMQRLLKNDLTTTFQQDTILDLNGTKWIQLLFTNK